MELGHTSFTPKAVPACAGMEKLGENKRCDTEIRIKKFHSPE